MGFAVVFKIPEGGTETRKLAHGERQKTSRHCCRNFFQRSSRVEDAHTPFCV